MQSSTDAGNGGPRKHTQSTAPQKQSEISETTSFTVNANTTTTTNSQPQQQNPGGAARNTPSKNPFKQQLDSNQQNGNMDQECGIMGVGKEPPVPPPPTYQSQSYAGRQPPPPADQYREEDPRAAGSWAAAKSWMVSWRGSNRLVLVIVAIALLLDNMLLTTVVPIIPEFLYDIRHPDAPLDSFPRTPLTSNVPPPPTPCPCNKDGSEAATLEISTISPEENETYYRELEERHNELVGETVEVGLLFASKAFVQLLVNPIVGPLTHRIGYSIPMFAGFVIMFLSTIIFAFGRSYLVLFVARALQGIGSSCSSVSGMGMLADRFTDDKERGNAMGIALGGLALGVLIGPPFGGVMYEFVGKSAPFLILAALALGDGLLQFFMLQPSFQKAETEPPSLKSLISDPYILIAAGAITFIPMATSITHLIIPNAGLGFAIGMVDSSMMPELAYLVDIRHSAVYGSVYALGDVAFCVGFAVGPALSGSLVKSIGFEWMLFGIAILCFMYAPLLTLLKNPPTSDEKKVRMAREAAEAAAAAVAASGDSSGIPQLTASCPAIMHGTSVPDADAEAGRTNEAYESERL
ncbi:GM20272 [Drosophila sechellia]|uniref:GM20272 n=1 Tax=Drosophila sechellia TaxID=7238 RepID=B4HQJ9_DROSE|nr:GM20272 [Drosophila sechellia]